MRFGTLRRGSQKTKSVPHTANVLVVAAVLLILVTPMLQVVAARISLPPGWDDSIIDRIKAGESTKMIVAVLDFENSDKLAGKVHLKLSDMLTTALVNSNRFELVERNKIDRVFQEQALQLTGAVDEAKVVEVGKLLGAEAVVFGSVTSVSQTEIDKFAYDVLKTEVSIDVRAVSVATGKILLSESATGIAEHKLIKTASGTVVSGSLDDRSGYATAARSAVNDAGTRIAKLSVLVGYVLDIADEQIFIDVGEELGVKSGDRFVIFRISKEIVHPVTGHRVGWAKEVICEIEIQTTEKSMSSGKVVRRESKNEIKPGDFAILNSATE